MQKKVISIVTRAIVFASAALCVAAAAVAAPPQKHVLVISIDGLGADYLKKADEYHLKIPTLRRFMKEGTYADGVVGVVPTVTYPSHTTLITGVWPSIHGVYNNSKFDPLMTLHGEAITDAKTVRVETLWHAAHNAGYITANVGWPVTTGADGIDYLLPANAAFERAQANPANPAVHYDYPAGLRDLLEKENPEITKLSVGEKRYALTLEILKRYKPGFMTTHLGDLDHAEHTTGPFSEESIRTLEFLDGRVAELVSLELANDPNAYVVVVSDHGFEPVEKTVNLGVLLAQAGLIRLSDTGAPVSWDAACWNAGGTTAIMLHDPSNKTVRTQLEKLLKEAARNPEYGIASTLTQDELVKRGGNPDAAFVVEAKPGYAFGAALTGKVVVDTPHLGTHGYLPGRPELRASFLLMGPGIEKGRNLGLIDMRQIAPTVAKLLGVKLSAAKEPALQ